MLLNDPPPTPLDFEFDIFRIPVRVSGLFWVLPIIFGIQNQHLIYAIVWALVMFVGILVHELGHALMMRRYGISPRIALIMMGGYATDNHRDVWGSFKGLGSLSGTPKILVSAAGPLAGFCLAGIVVGLVVLMGGWVEFKFAYGFFPYWYVELEKGVPFGGEFPLMADMPTNKDMMHQLIYASLLVNIYWGIMNLMPVDPLDGGSIARELMIKSDPVSGVRNSLWLGVFVGAGVAFFGIFVLEAFFLGIMFAYFAFQSWQKIQMMDGKGFGGGRW